MAASISMDEWLAELESLRRKGGPKGAEGHTSGEIRDHLGLGGRTVLRLLREAKAAGRLQVGTAARESLDGRQVMVPVYKIVAGKKK